jgi:2,4-dienoyl-CoA reductase-like NADH-dependent reductase (Old Yellow Enzyme family)
MIERIKELAVQAGHRYYPSSNSGPLRVEYLTPELEKFAELIVKECIDIVGAGGEFASRPKLVEKLQEHFGVEE